MLSRSKQADIQVFFILAIALGLRVWMLDVKMPHFDEGINGWFVDRMRSQGFYKYDPTNYHGPFHFYTIFASLSLFGRNVIALRIPAVIASMLSIWWMFRFANVFPRTICRVAALMMAVSPAFVFYGRYSIHESWLLFFLMVAVWGILTFWKYRSREGMWAAGMGMTGMILTKETYIIHIGCFILAGLTLWMLEKAPSFLEKMRAREFRRRARFELNPVQARIGESLRERGGRFAQRIVKLWGRLGHLYSRADFYLTDFVTIASVSVLLIVVFYSGFFLYWPGVAGIFLTYKAWITTGMGSTHGKPWHEWLHLMWQFEWPGLLGLAASMRYLFPADRRTRYLAIYATGCVAAYSLVQYKTPWCIIVMLWPFYLVLGCFLFELGEKSRWWKVLWILPACALVHSLWVTVDLNFRRYEDKNIDYVYVQTFADVQQITRPILEWARRDPTRYHERCLIFMDSTFPLPWMLGDFTDIKYYSKKTGSPEVYDAPFLLVDPDRIREVELQLRDSYYTKWVTVRAAMEPVKLYLRSTDFQAFFPGETPDWTPASIPDETIEVRRAIPVAR